MRMTAFEQSWSVIVRIESYPWDMGNLVMKSRAMVAKGIASGVGNIGCNGAFVGRVLTLCLWHSAHPLTYSMTSFTSCGHQYCRATSCAVLLIPGCPYTGVSW